MPDLWALRFEDPPGGTFPALETAVVTRGDWTSLKSSGGFEVAKSKFLGAVLLRSYGNCDCFRIATLRLVLIGGVLYDYASRLFSGLARIFPLTPKRFIHRTTGSSFFISICQRVQRLEPKFRVLALKDQSFFQNWEAGEKQLAGF